MCRINGWLITYLRTFSAAACGCCCCLFLSALTPLPALAEPVSPAAAPAAAHAVRVTGVTVWPQEDFTRIIVTGDRSFTPTVRSQENPTATVITVAGSWNAGRTGGHVAFARRGVSDVRYGPVAGGASEPTVRILASTRGVRAFSLESSRDKRRWEIRVWNLKFDRDAYVYARSGFYEPEPVVRETPKNAKERLMARVPPPPPIRKRVRVAVAAAPTLPVVPARRAVVSDAADSPVMNIPSPAPVRQGAQRPAATTVRFSPYRSAALKQVATAAAAASPALHAAPRQTAAAATLGVAQPGLYSVSAYQTNVVALLTSLARDAGVSVIMAGAISEKVTVNLRKMSIDKAIDLVTKAAGLAYYRDGDTYVVGAAKDIATAFPKEQINAVMRQEVYHCRNITASDLVASLEKMFDKDQLRIALGAGASSPRLDDASTSAVTGVQASTLNSNTPTTAGLGAREIILYGEADVVARALALAQQLDVRRAQVRIGVQITDIGTDALKELGVRWSFGNQRFTENKGSGMNFGSFSRSPLSIDATLAALETDNRAKLLAAPTLSLLDGERGFILIGERLQFPKLIGYTQAQTPIFDKEEERVGIYLQVAVQTAGNGEITLTIYPQVSVVTSFLTVNGASYPQISTREQQTTIRVKDGEKIVVGGLIRDEELTNIERVPLLSRIPLFGELFTYRKKTRRQSKSSS